MNVYDNIQVQKHVVAESSMLKATNVGHIYSLKMIKDTDNGSIVSRGDFVEAQVFNAKDYVPGEQALLVLTPALGYNSDRRSYKEERFFYNAQGEIARAYELHEGDIFTISEDGITALGAAPVVGNYAKIENGLYKEATDAPATGIVLKIIEQVNYTNSKSYRLHVEKIG